MARSQQNWKKVRLEEVCEDITVGHVGPMADEYVEEGIPFLRSQNIEPFRINTDGLKFISEAFHRRLKKCALRPGDVAVVRTGYPGTAAVIPSWLPAANCADLVVIRPSSAISSVFLVAVLNSAWGRSHIAGQLVGVAQQHFNIGNARRLELALPPIELQHRVADILSAYDDLIENNTKRIKILEEMARSLYREWFVNFRFPGHTKAKFVRSPLGQVPATWSLGKLGDRIELAYGKALKAEDRRPGQVAVYGSSGLVGWHDEEMCSGPGIIVGRKGNVGSVHWSDTPFFAIDTVFFVRTALPLHFVFLNLQGQNFLNNDAAVPGLNRNQAYSLPLLVPEQPLLEEFQQFASSVFTQIKLLSLASTNLRTTRDLLLPRLISGEIDVSSLRVE